ncbi:MAG: DUF6252 family protein [Bacteroidota bacterium]
MKKHLTLLSFCLIALLFNSCKKGSSDGGVEAVSYYMTFKVDGVAQSVASTPYAVLHKDENVIYLFGPLNNQNGAFTIDIFSSQLGTYPTQQDPTFKNNVFMEYYTDYGDGSVYYGRSGTVTITEITSTTLSGTFQFTATNAPSNSLAATKTITEGKFKVKFSTVN